MKWSSARALVAIAALGWVGSTLGGCSDEDVGAKSIEEALRANGIDLDELFASPTAAEVARMRAIWSERELGVVDLQEEGAFALRNGDTIRVLSHLVGEQRHYGVVILPAGQHPPASLSVVVSLIGFGVEMVLDVPPDARAYGGTRVTVIPSFRGHELRFAGETWVSDGDPFDQCDGASDDAIAFIQAAIEATPEADPSAMVALGGSRGGNVAMLVAIRQPSIGAVVNIAGPTDYHRQDLLDHANLSALYANHFLRDLLEGGSDVSEARRRMLACSPFFSLRSYRPPRPTTARQMKTFRSRRPSCWRHGWQSSGVSHQSSSSSPTRAPTIGSRRRCLRLKLALRRSSTGMRKTSTEARALRLERA